MNVLLIGFVELDWTYIDTIVKHKRYGALFSFCEIEPIIIDSALIYEGWIKIGKPTKSYKHCRNTPILTSFHKSGHYDIFISFIRLYYSCRYHFSVISNSKEINKLVIGHHLTLKLKLNPRLLH